MRTEYGIWSNRAGAFVQTGFWSKDGQQTASRFVELAKRGDSEYFDSEEARDWEVTAVCRKHADEPADGCFFCDDESNTDE